MKLKNLILKLCKKVLLLGFEIKNAQNLAELLGFEKMNK